MPSLADIGGYPYQKEEAKRIADFFRHYEEYTSKGAELPRGIFFYGQPGNGKTMFAKAIATEAGVPLVELTSDATLDEKGVVHAIIDAFDRALSQTPCVLLIDELDRIVAATPARALFRPETDQQRVALRTLISQIDKVKGKGILIVATANVDLMMIPAPLVRDGRIEKHVEIDVPDIDDRKEILSLYMRKNPVFDEVAVEDVSSYTNGLSCAALVNLVNEVLIHCISENKKAEFHDFLEPIAAIRASGSKAKDPKNIDSVIYHEIGHFIADYALNKNVGMIVVSQHGGAAGMYSRQDFVDNCSELSLGSLSEMKKSCVVSISGLVATELFLGEPYMGASKDLGKIVTRYIAMCQSGLMGMKPLAMESLNSFVQDGPYKDFQGDCLDRYETFLQELKYQSESILREYEDLAHALFEELKKKPVLTHAEIQEIIERLQENEPMVTRIRTHHPKNPVRRFFYDRKIRKETYKRMDDNGRVSVGEDDQIPVGTYRIDVVKKSEIDQ